MSPLRRLSAVCATVLVASGLVVAPFLTGPASAAELIQDGSFEAATGNPPNSPGWAEADTERGSPICTTSLCPTSAQVSPPRTGTQWIVFGARSVASHTASMSQAVTIPSGGTATLTYWYRSAEVSDPFNATVSVRVDGTTLVTHTETSTSQPGYSQQTVNLNGYANGASHTISFNYSANGSSSSQRLVIDDVSVNWQDSTPPGQVTLTGVTPASPNTSTTPVVTGNAEAGSTVKLYGTAGCTGSPLATGPAAAFAAPGLTANVVLGSTTTFRATATDAAGNTSACSASSVTYKSDLRDGGFEAATGNPALSPDWTEADSQAAGGTPLCTVATCTPGAEIAPHGGSAWVWFGGFDTAGHTGSMSQAVTIPVGSVALSYWYRNSSVTAPFDAVLLVQVDGTTVKTHIEAPEAETAYTRQLVDLSPFANGASHVLSFSYTNGGAGVNNMLVDDVGLVAGSAPHTATPTVTVTVPASPSTSRTPKVKGTAETGSTVTLYSNSTCTSAALGTGSAADFAVAGITATVPAAATTTAIYAKAVKAGQNDSACSTTFVAYKHLGEPETTLVKTPKKKVSTRKPKHKVVFVFSSTTPGATFECSIDGKRFRACTSGHKLKLKVGKHTFAVRAVAAGLTDPTPATYKFKIKRKR